MRFVEANTLQISKPRKNLPVYWALKTVKENATSDSTGILAKISERAQVKQYDQPLECYGLPLFALLAILPFPGPTSLDRKRRVVSFLAFLCVLAYFVGPCAFGISIIPIVCLAYQPLQRLLPSSWDIFHAAIVFEGSRYDLSRAFEPDFWGMFLSILIGSPVDMDERLQHGYCYGVSTARDYLTAISRVPIALRRYLRFDDVFVKVKAGIKKDLGDLPKSQFFVTVTH
jgi:hypothetical protein